jgi:hypothetical protein
MTISLKESQAITKIADVLYEFLPGSRSPYSDQTVSFPGVARKLGLFQYWVGGSKRPAITKLLQATLDTKRILFCELILEIVRTGMIYRSSQQKPITREEIQKLNELVTQVNFKIPEMWDPAFLDSLPRSKKPDPTPHKALQQDSIQKLKNDLINLTTLSPQERGFAFEKFLNELFSCYNLDPRSSFRIKGEQIDGSFQIGTDIYLVEAKWHNEQIGQEQLLVFHGKVGGKSAWSRGLFISYNGFTPDGLTAFSKGRPTNMIGMNSQDLFLYLTEPCH